MGIALSEDHRTLADVVADFSVKHELLGAARALLEAPEEATPEVWGDLADMGWLGLHLPEECGGSGFGIEELVVVVGELGRVVAPGPFVPSVIASAVIASAGDADLRARLLPGFASGELIGAVALSADVSIADGKVTGGADAVLSAGLAASWCCPRVTTSPSSRWARASRVESPPNLDPTRRFGRVRLDAAPATVLPGARRSAGRPGADDPGRRSGRGRGRVREPVRRVRERARAVRPGDRHLPGREAPLLEHVRGVRDRDRGRLGRGARGGERR